MLFKFGLVTTALAAVVVGSAGSAVAVSGGAAADPAALPFLAKVQVGDQRGCSGALVAPQWVLTTRSCLAEPSSAQEGTPPAGTRVTLIGGRTETVTWVRPHPERDLALLRLAKRTRGITTAAIATAAPADGAALRAAGFGRTATEWVPQTAHVGDFTVSAAGPATLDIDSTTATLCLGDTGAPLLTAGGQIAAVASASWQGGCLLVDETRRGGVAQRVDDLGAWVRTNTPDMCASPGHSTTTNQQTSYTRMADFTGDCAADLAGVFANNDLRVNGASGRLDDALASYPRTRPVREGISATAVPRIITGDFNGDGRSDIGFQWSNTDLRLYASLGDLSADHSLFNGGMVFGANWDSSKVQRILTGDFNGDGVTDIAAQLVDKTIKIHLLSRESLGKVLATQTVTRVGGWGPDQFPTLLTGDLNGDGRTDLFGVGTTGVLRAYGATGTMSGNWIEGSGRVLSDDTWKLLEANRVVVGDFNGDGVDDVGVERGELKFYYRGRNWAAAGTFVAGAGWQPSNVARILTGDVNGDGRDEILANYVPGTGEWGGDIRIYQPGYGPTVRAINDWTTTSVPRLI